MQLWRLSGAAFAESFDGGFGLEHDGRWNGRGRPITYCSTGPALCVLEKLADIEEAGLLPDDTMLVRYHVPVADTEDRNIIVNHRHKDVARITVAQAFHSCRQSIVASSARPAVASVTGRPAP